MGIAGPSQPVIAALVLVSWGVVAVEPDHFHVPNVDADGRSATALAAGFQDPAGPYLHRDLSVL